MCRCLFRAVLLALGLLVTPSTQAWELVVVVSDAGGAYGEFANALQQFVEGSAWNIRWSGDGDAFARAAPKADLIIAVGSEATRSSLKRTTAPVLATLLPRQAFEKIAAELDSPRPRGSLSAIYLDQPVHRLLGLAHHLLPDRPHVGVLTGTDSRAQIPALRMTASSQGQLIVTEDVDGETPLITALQQVFARSDLLLALPDNAIYRRENVRTILLTSYRFQKPLIGFSQALVSAGALAGVFSTPSQIARQTADFLRMWTPEGTGLPPPQMPTLFTIAVNRNVAQALGLKLPDEPALRRALGADKEGK